VKSQAKANPTAKQSLAKNGVVFLVGSIEEAREITNRIAPEHLTVDEPSDIEWVKNAGSVFIGSHSPQPMGDYVSGPNHTLPTVGYARVRGGLSVMDFAKIITVQQYDESALKVLGPAAIALAEAEGLMGHAEAIRAREIATPKGEGS
jgi:histidinol dehydrogenase